MKINNHPANGPVSLDRLHQIREHLLHDTQHSNGGNRDYILADMLKVIDVAIASFGAAPVLYAAEETLAYAKMGELHLKCLSHPMGDAVIPLYTAPPAPVSPDKMTVEMAYPRVQTNWHDANNFAEGWNACLAAMLQSLGNSQQLDEVGSWNNHRNTPTANPAIDTGELLKHIEGMEVSVDVSTCDADAGHRYFGTVTEISELDTAKNGYILLVQDAKPNFNHTEQHLDMVGRSGDANQKVDFRLTFDQWLSQQNEPIDVDCGCVTTEAFYHWLRVAYEAGNSPVTPDGYVLVPKEITCAMDDAAWEAYHETRCMSDIWAALLAAAPQQE